MKQLTHAATAAVLLLVFMSPEPARGQAAGMYRVRQGRRVGRVTLPTPPFNPDAGILDGVKGRGHKASKGARRRASRRDVRAGSRGTAQRVSRRKVNKRRR